MDERASEQENLANKCAHANVCIWCVRIIHNRMWNVFLKTYRFISIETNGFRISFSPSFNSNTQHHHQHQKWSCANNRKKNITMPWINNSNNNNNKYESKRFTCKIKYDYVWEIDWLTGWASERVNEWVSGLEQWWLQIQTYMCIFYEKWRVSFTV